MEQEKLAESIRTFEEDKDRYKQYIEQLGVEAQAIEREVKEKVKDKNILVVRLNRLLYLNFMIPKYLDTLLPLL